ncbi:S-type pyocin domain-containing protein [Pseudomonas asiatica]|uniref:S-type pyocin domain-containing protein n=2 Tax=Pseudomonas TaxID=286 RepID=A0AAJ5I110_9PSED|nr:MULTISPECIES: S-type pyocin domain-containing protein [Pseudomonas]MCO7526236.1 S-type pyocin domain-containing protein [Pseudomonas asiatica]MDM9597553.1 S-type pyocin domain-containing protein [Pseudomonas shirazica]MDO2415489.1 S-type pyocin domain-containing protein [Pseudomonas shirazica]MDS9589140.1 S-type pyocin domain-containing protein [Pseudomonas sp. HTZ1]QKK94845.1 HNH nuclease [Pseudomonas sp. 13159349]
MQGPLVLPDQYVYPTNRIPVILPTLYPFGLPHWPYAAPGPFISDIPPATPSPTALPKPEQLLDAIRSENTSKFELGNIIQSVTEEVEELAATLYANDINARKYAMEDLILQKLDEIPLLDTNARQLLGFNPTWRSSASVISSYEQKYGKISDNPDLFVQRATQSYAHSKTRDFIALQIYHLSQQLQGSTTEQVRARVQAREAARMAARAAANAEAERIAAEAAAKAEAERIAAEAAAKAEAERIAAETATVRAANTYSTSGSIAQISSVVLTAAGTVSSNTPLFSLRTVLGTAIGALEGYAVAVGSGFIVGVSALLYSPRLGNGELPDRYSLQTPLSDLAPQVSIALATNEGISSTAEMPYRFSSRTTAEGASEIFVVKANGGPVPFEVRVLTASFDAQRNIYTATTADSPPRTLTWTPIDKPGDSSTSLPSEQKPPKIYPGAELLPVEIRIDSYPGIADANLDDYIVVFPADSGLPPIYTMFRDRREDPGTASGYGPQVDESWSRGASTGEGAPIPMQVADLLRGRNFPNWRSMREAIWKAIGNDEMLSKQFSRVNISRMRKGLAPYVPKNARVGKRVVVELHHKTLISRGGEVYNAENIFLTTPDLHIQIHQGN